MDTDKSFDLDSIRNTADPIAWVVRGPNGRGFLGIEPGTIRLRLSSGYVRAYRYRQLALDSGFVPVRVAFQAGQWVESPPILYCAECGSAVQESCHYHPDAGVQDRE